MQKPEFESCKPGFTALLQSPSKASNEYYSLPKPEETYCLQEKVWAGGDYGGGTVVVGDSVMFGWVGGVGGAWGGGDAGSWPPLSSRGHFPCQPRAPGPQRPPLSPPTASGRAE